MSAKIAVLGLVIEEPSPAHRLTAKLRQRLTSTGFVDSNVYSALTRLEREGLIRGVKAGVEVGPAGPLADPDADPRHFEATPAGVRVFEEWLQGSSIAPPLRDELHIKIALCKPRDLARMIELVYGQELVCLARVQDLRSAYGQAQPPRPDHWQGLVMVLTRDAEICFWEARINWLQGVRCSLERMRGSFEDATRQPGKA